MDGNGGVARGTGWNEQVAERGEDFDEMLQPPPRSEHLHGSLAFS